MSAAQVISETVREQWIERTLKSYPAETFALMSAEADPFRNPAGHTLRESLTTLARELPGAMDKDAVAAALDAIIRLRAVQNFRPAEALRFIFEFRALLREECGAVPQSIDSRIDELALMAFDQYMACREQIFELRAKELGLRARYAAG